VVTLTNKVKTGLQWTTASTLGRALIQIVQLSVAAHYLSAAELGIYALVQLCLGFCQMYMDMGVGQAIIHQQDILERHYSELFVVNLLVATLLTVVVYCFAPLLAWLFDASALTVFLQIMSVSFVLSAVGRIHLVSLQKELVFSVLAKIELFSVVIGFLLAVTMLIQGAGLYSLVYGYLTHLLIQAMLAWMYSAQVIRLCWPRSWRKLSKYLIFGAYQTTDSTVNYINSHIDIFLVGKLLGTEVLGGYSLVRQFCFRPAMIINQTFTRVAFPMMAKLQNSPNLSKVYCQLVSVLAALNFPLYIAIFVLAEPIVNLLFGPSWKHLVPLLQIMSLWCLLRSAMNPVGSLLLAVGKVKLALKWNSLLLLIMPVSIFVGAGFGIEGVALALLILQFVLIPGHWWFLLYQSAGIHFKQFLSTLVRPFILSALTGSFVMMMLILNDTHTYLIKLLFGLGLGGVTYILISIKFNTHLVSILKGNYKLDDE
jgi:O-antigen/teichoic acid export membrane protein